MTVYPGSYKFTAEKVLKEPEQVVETLRTILENQRRGDPSIGPVPRVRFLIERGGQDLYWATRGRLEVDRPSWRLSWEAAAPRTFSLFGSERW